MISQIIFQMIQSGAEIPKSPRPAYKCPLKLEMDSWATDYLRPGDAS